MPLQPADPPPGGPPRTDRSPLHPYIGFRDDVTEHLGAPWSKRTLDRDVSGEVEYRYNALGFRGPEYDAGADFQVFVFGESDAFGAGVAEEDAWPVRVARALAEERGQTLGLMNFSEPAASNAYISRTCLMQCAAVRPDAVLIALADDDREEGILGDRVSAFGPWIGEIDVDAAVAPLTGAKRARVEEVLRRGRAHLRYDGVDLDLPPAERPNEPTGRLRTLRAVLLMQEFLKRHDIPYVVVSRERYRTFGPETSQHPLLGPLLALVDEGRVSSVATVDVVGGNVGADGAHFTPAGHARIAERVLEESAGALAPERALDPVSEAVVAFFEELPFNFHASDEAMRRSLGETDPVTSHMPDLARVAARSDVSRALDVGCGAGWLAFTLAGHLGLEVEAIDLCRPALARARRMARHVGVDDRVRIREASVFDLEGDGAYDLTLAMGVLHHTRDPREALARMVAATRPGGFVHVGLYHRPSRGVFLDELRRVVRQEGEERAFELFRALAPAKADDVRHARSWFRAQLHVPHESHHTLAEVAGWFEELGVELCSTSLNRFADLRSPEELEALEADYVDTVRTAVHEERRFLPGFFTALGRRR